jgi:hypothetical protein
LTHLTIENTLKSRQRARVALNPLLTMQTGDFQFIVHLNPDPQIFMRAAEV